MKLKVGVFSFTCCEGCVVMLIETLNKKYFDWKEKIEFTNFKTLRPARSIQKLDIAIVEGAISTKDEVKKLKKIREKSKVLIALGLGAISGAPSNQRNKFPSSKKKEIQPLIKKMKQIEKISPLKTFVKVDDKIPGCPVSEQAVIKKIDKYIKNA